MSRLADARHTVQPLQFSRPRVFLDDIGDRMSRHGLSCASLPIEILLKDGNRHHCKKRVGRVDVVEPGLISALSM
jgi:hypothetical protein